MGGVGAAVHVVPDYPVIVVGTLCVSDYQGARPFVAPRSFGGHSEGLRWRMPVGCPRLEEPYRSSGRVCGYLPQRRKVVHYPEGATVGGDDKIVVLYFKVVDGHHGQVLLQRLPPVSAVEGYPHAVFRACVKQPILLRVFPDNAGEVVGGDPPR